MTPEELSVILNTELSPDKMGDMTPNELATRLISMGLIDNAADMNCMVIEKLQQAIADDDEIPVHYYKDGEEIPDEHKEVKGVQCLTDDYIANNLR